jgi:hypothetical protein
MEDLREHLRTKLLSAKGAERQLAALQSSAKPILDALAQRIGSVERVLEYCRQLEPPIEHAELVTYLAALREAESGINGFLREKAGVNLAVESVAFRWWSLTAAQADPIDRCQAAIEALPDSSGADRARDTLIVAQERYERYVRAGSTEGRKAADSVVASKVLAHYNNSCTQILEGIYDAVADTFKTYYCVVNREDEKDFVCKLDPAPAKLSLDVDFYGRGLFPPGAYHSEGHQDGMGLCLYLALMKHTLGDKFAFAVLDDVLMSVDADHRREVCRLLKSEFPNTQFVLTTHDRVWLQYMRSEGLIARSKVFAGWTVESGPRVWDDRDVWSEIAGELAKNEVAKAAWLLRRYLEFTAATLADNLRARIEFRGDGHYDLGDLLPPSLKEWQRRLESAERSARTWGQLDAAAALADQRAEAKKLIVRTKAEEWTINPSVHFNQWANLQAHEFQQVAHAFKELLDSLRCKNPECGSYLYVSPQKGNAEEIRCNCGATVINLRTRT